MDSRSGDMVSEDSRNIRVMSSGQTNAFSVAFWYYLEYDGNKRIGKVAMHRRKPSGIKWNISGKGIFIHMRMQVY
ncbi:MAG: hypothetical protein PHV95_09115 [Eubacteriales bacterium]|nr:hypothetical protein [Eubacteriales bacterium]